MSSLIAVLIFLLGACVGSFLNVCIYRIPKNQSVISPRSRCRCGKPIAWIDNIPILSWLLLKGKARCCRRHISVSYIIVEIITAFLFLYSWLYFDTIGLAIAGMFFAFLLLGSTFIDWDTLTIPDRFSVGGVVLGLAVSLLVPEMHGQYTGTLLRDTLISFITSVSGLCVGSGLLIWIAIFGEILFNKESMGFGDIKLIGCIGVFCGWQGAVFSIFMGATLGVAFMIPILTFHLSKKDWANSKKKLSEIKVPFGPWLALAGALYFFLLKSPVDNYFATLSNTLF